MIGALGQHVGAMLRSALLHGLQGFSVLRQDDILVFGEK
jgi:hypothetical protein